VINLSEPFNYVLAGEPRTGFYRDGILVAVAGSTITTVMANVTEDYILRLKERSS
jgi:hypothetical protein